MNKKEVKKWYQSPSNLVIAIACIILVPMLIINLWIMIQSKTSPDKVPSIFGYKPFMVLTSSMEAEILKGDLIITKEVDPGTLKVNDIIAFRDSEGTITTHRIIDEITRNNEKLFITKGDNNNSQDRNLVTMNDVEGKYVLRIPGVGSIMKALSEPSTIAIIILGITILFGIGFMISTKRQQELERLEFLEYKKAKEKDEQESKTNKMKSIKAEEDEDLPEDEEEVEEKKENKQKNNTSTNKKKHNKKNSSKKSK